jgi:GYF domain 2/RDD family
MWYVEGGSVARGPHRGDTIVEMIGQSAINPGTRVAKVGWKEWTALADVPVFKGFLAGRGAAVGSAVNASLVPPAYAGFWIRLGAFALDYFIVVILFALAALLAYGTVLVIAGSARAATEPMLTLSGLLSVASLCLGTFYYVYFPRSPWQATPSACFRPNQTCANNGNGARRSDCDGVAASCDRPKLFTTQWDARAPIVRTIESARNGNSPICHNPRIIIALIQVEVFLRLSEGHSDDGRQATKALSAICCRGCAVAHRCASLQVFAGSLNCGDATFLARALRYPFRRFARCADWRHDLRGAGGGASAVGCGTDN